MKTLIKPGILLGILVSLFSCSKDDGINHNVAYKTYYMVLNNTTNASLPVYDVKFDIDGDAKNDFLLSGHFDQEGGDTTISTILLGNATTALDNAFVTGVHTFPDGKQVNLLRFFLDREMISGTTPYFTPYGAAVLNAFEGDHLFYSVGIIDSGEKLIGFKFLKDGGTHYGWLRIYLSDDRKVLVVKDGAYNKVAGEGIEAGMH